MGTKESIPNRRYTAEFKHEAVKLADAIGAGPAAKRLGVPDSSLWNWIRLSRRGKLKVAASGTAAIKRGDGDLEAENARLRRELANAKADLEIVKKAAAYFAKESR
jgi:transposase